MAWKECDRVSLRREFVSLGSMEGTNLAALCRRFGISRKTAYKWLARYRAEGDEGLADRSRRPHRFRLPTSPQVEQEVLAIRDEHPTWGGRKIRARLLHLGREEVPAASTITAILHRHGRIDREESAKREPWRRFERALPNELWQMDFKGEFKMTNGWWCYPLTVLDDHSRYSIGLIACGNQRWETVCDCLSSMFRRYGLPLAMLMDNGVPWSAPHLPRGQTRLSVWLMKLDIDVLHGRPYHPQTQGKDERFHRTLGLELLQGRHFDDLVHTQRRFDPWREMYNHERPHEALDMQVPATRYRVSQRAFPELIPPFEYDGICQVRVVRSPGRFNFRGRAFKISLAFVGEQVALRPSSEDGVWEVYFRHYCIGQLDLRRPDTPSTIAAWGASASARYARSSGRPPEED